MAGTRGGSPAAEHSAYILHSRPYRETSVLLDLFSREGGRLSAVYRGGRSSGRSSSRAKAKPEPFVLYHAGLHGSRELKTVGSFEVDSHSGPRRLQGVQLFSGLYVNELLYKLLQPNAPQAEIFQAYEDVLLALHNTSNFEAHLRHFELKLMANLGYGLSFDVEADGLTPILPEQHYVFNSGAGFEAAGPSDSQRGLSGELLQRIQEGHWQERAVMSVLKQINQQALNFLLKGKPIKSREFLRKSRS